jgi:hypothetical protein
MKPQAWPLGGFGLQNGGCGVGEWRVQGRGTANEIVEKWNKKNVALNPAPVIYYKSRRRKGDCRDGARSHGLPTLKQAAFRPSHRRKKSDPVAKLTA